MKATKLLTLTTTLLLLAGAAQAQLNGTWQGVDVGGNDLSPKGSFDDQLASGGTLKVTGGGWDIWGGWDGYYYYYNTVTGLFWNATIKVDSLERQDGWTKCELMAHRLGGELANTAFIAAMTTPTGGSVGLQFRPRGGTDCGDFPSVMTSVFPMWMRLSRQGALFTMYTSTDGVTWTKGSEIDTSKTDRNFDGIPWPWTDGLGLGVAITSHKNGTPATATISKLTVEETTIAVPPTVLAMTVTPTNTAAYQGCEASFYFDTTNNAYGPLPHDVTSYQWYKKAVGASSFTAIPAATGNNLTFLATLPDKGAQLYCQASLYGLTVISPTVTLTDVAPATIYTGTLKQEIFWGATSTDQVDGGRVGAGSVSTLTSFEAPTGIGDTFIRRVSGFFTPKTSGNYAFFICSDDDSKLYLSLTGSNPADKQLIAQQTGWADARKWVSGGDVLLKRSDQWSPDGSGAPTPYAAGIPLTAGQAYYIEAVHHEGTGGDNLGVTYKLVDPADPYLNDPVDGDATRITADQISLMTWPITGLAWTLQPTNDTKFEGQTVTFRAQAIVNSEFPVSYQWYRNNSPIAGATGSSYAFTTVGADNNAQFKVVATAGAGGFSITSSTAILVVKSAVFERGWVKLEMWTNLTDKAVVANGGAGDPTYSVAINGFGATANVADNYIRRISGFFIPTNNDSLNGNRYSFYINSDDDSDLYLSTNNLPANKQMIAQQPGSSGLWQWRANSNQKVSDSFTVGGNTPNPYGIELPLGQPCYLEVIHHEGTGEDHVEVYGSSYSDYGAQVTNGAQLLLQGEAMGMNALSCNWVAFTRQPQSVVASLYGSATFSVAASTDSTQPVSGTGVTVTNQYVIYQWMKDGVDIPGATASIYTTPMVVPGTPSAQYVCKIRALGYGTGLGTSFVAMWSNSVVANMTVASVYEPGFARVDFWGLGNNPSIQAIENDTAGTPTYVTTSPRFEADIEGGPDTAERNNYGRRVTGFFTPPTTGEYVFFITGDDNAELFLNAAGEDPAGKQMVAQQVGWGSSALNWNTDSGGGVPSQRHSDTWTNSLGETPWSAGIHLEANKRYFMMAAQKDGTGGDFVAVNFKKMGEANPVDGTDSQLAGNAIGFYAPKSSWVNFVQQPASVSVATVSPVTFSVQGTTDSILSVGSTRDPVTNIFLMYQWMKNGVDIPGATASSYTLMAMPGDTAQYMCKIRALGYANASGLPIWSNSQPAVINFAPDTVAPSLLYAGYFTNGAGAAFVDVKFSEWMDAATLANSANYLIPGLTVTSVTINSNNFANVRLAVSGTRTSPFQVSVLNLKDAAGNPLGGSPSAAYYVLPLAFQDIGNGTNDPANPSQLWLDGTNAFTVAAQGSDIWNNTDGFNFLYEQKTGDFDVVVRQKSITHANNWSKGGLMVRETLDFASREWCVVNTPRSSDGIAAPDGSGNGANDVECGARTTAGAATAGWGISGVGAVPAYPNAWVRLTRAGTLLSAYCSTNGVTWTLLGTNTPSPALPNTVFVGVATTSHNNSAWNTSEYADYNSSFVALAPAATLKVSLSGANAVISWTPDGGRLQSSSSLSGGWADVTGATNPMTVATDGQPKFFRVVNP